MSRDCPADYLSRPAQPAVKVWGVTWPVITSTLYARFALETHAGGFSSLHFHRNRANRFHVIEGAIFVYEHTSRDARAQLLRKGDTFDVFPLSLHSFAVLQSGFVIEEYYAPGRPGVPPVDVSDIERLSEGGWLEVNGEFPRDVLTMQRRQCQAKIDAFCQEFDP